MNNTPSIPEINMIFMSFFAFIQLVGCDMAHNVRRYVALPQSRGGACFCTRGAMQDCDGYYIILALAKTVTPGGGPRREPGRAVPPTT